MTMRIINLGKIRTLFLSNPARFSSLSRPVFDTMRAGRVAHYQK
jgi:hypothetical protein